MDERLRFVARLLEGEKMAPLCREFGISRVTGYKIFARYKESGLEGLHDRSRRPYRQANQLPYQVERLILSRQVKRLLKQCNHLRPTGLTLSTGQSPTNQAPGRSVEPPNPLP